MDPNFLQQAVDYHGSRLIDALRNEQGENFTKSLLLKRKDVTEPSTSKGDSKLDDDKKALIASFIAKKADMLFKPYKCSETIVNPAIELEDKDKYAIVPPIECFMNVEGDARKRHFYNTLVKGDVVIGRVSGKHIHGLIITLLCLNAGKMRYIDDLSIKCFCHVHNIPQVSAHEDPLDEFNVNDLVQGVVNEISPESEKIYISMVETAFAHVTQLHLKLGLITEDDLPLHYKKSIKLGGESFESCTNRTLGFMNPSIVPQLCLKMGVNIKSWPSLMRGLHEKVYPRSDYAVELYKTQCSQWAYKSVKQGVDYFKAGNKVEAFQCLNKALQIDPLNVEAFVARGALYANNGALSRSLEDFEKALEVDSSHVNARKFIVTTLIAYGKQLEDDGRIEEAIRNYKRAMVINPSNQEAMQHMKISQKKLAEREDSRGRSQDTIAKESASTTDTKNKRDPTTKERLRQLLSADRGRQDREKQRERRKQKSMSPVELSSTTSDSSSSDSSSSESSTSSTDSSLDSSEENRRRKNGNHSGYSSKSRAKNIKTKRKSLELDAVKRRRTSSSSQSNKHSRRVSGDNSEKYMPARQRDSSSNSKCRESTESQLSAGKSSQTYRQRRDSAKSVQGNIFGTNYRSNRLSVDNAQSASNSESRIMDSSEGRLTEVIDKGKAGAVAASSKAPTLNELESFLANLRAAKSAPRKDK